MKVLNEAVLSELQVITLEASLLHSAARELRKRALAAIGVDDDGYLADKVQELVDVEGVDFYDVASHLMAIAANQEFDEAAELTTNYEPVAEKWRPPQQKVSKPRFLRVP